MRKIFLILFFVIAAISFAENEAPKTEEEVAPIEEILKPDTSSNKSLWKLAINTFVTLGAIIIAVIIISWFLKRLFTSQMKFANQKNMVKVLEKRALTQRSSIYVIEVEGKRMVVADSQAGGISHLADLPAKFTVKKEEKPEK